MSDHNEQIDILCKYQAWKGISLAHIRTISCSHSLSKGQNSVDVYTEHFYEAHFLRRKLQVPLIDNVWVERGFPQFIMGMLINKALLKLVRE